MKKLLLVLLVVLLSETANAGYGYVNFHKRSNGTYVNPYTRQAPIKYLTHPKMPKAIKPVKLPRGKSNTYKVKTYKPKKFKY